MNSNSDAADGRHTTPGGITGENLLIPESGSGPGLLLLADGQVPETAVQARARLFAEEGYVTAVLCGALAAPDVREAAIRLKDSAETTGGPVCVAHGDIAGAALDAADAFAALVIFDAPGVAGRAGDHMSLPCPVVFQFGTLDATDATAAAGLAGRLNSGNGSRLYVWPEAAPGFALPGHAAARAGQAGRDHLGVVQDQPVTGPQPVGQIRNARVSQPRPLCHQQPGRRPWPGGPRCNQPLGEIKIEVAEFHGPHVAGFRSVRKIEPIDWTSHQRHASMPATRGLKTETKC